MSAVRVGAGPPPPPLTPQARDSILRTLAQEQALLWRLYLRPAEDRGKALVGSRVGELTGQGRTALARAAMADEAARANPTPGPRGPRADDVVRAVLADAARRWGGMVGSRGLGLPGGGPSRRQRARDAAVEADVQAGLARMAERMRRRADSLAWLAESTASARGAVPSPR